MDYKDYIELGFERIDMNDGAEFDQTGYAGFILSKKLNKLACIEVCSGFLDKPKLYVKSGCDDMPHYIFPLSIDQMIETLKKR